MTAGDYHGRGYGHDDEHPSYDPDGYEGHPALPRRTPSRQEPWLPPDQWAEPAPDQAYWEGPPSPPQWADQPVPPQPGGWPDQQPGQWHGSWPDQQYGQPYGQQADPQYGQPYGEQWSGEGGHPGQWGAWSTPEQAGYPGGPASGEPVGPVYREQWEVVGAAAPSGAAGDPDAPTGRGGRRKRGLPLWQELPLLLVIALCLAILVRTFLLQAFFIPSGSMETTLEAGDRVLVNKVVYHFREPARGEVVVFQGTDEWTPQPVSDGDIGFFAKVTRGLGDLVGITRPEEKEYIKRIIGLPGDRVSCCDVDGRVFVNGQPLNEDYVIHDAPLADREDGGVHDCRTRRFDEVVVEPGQMFVMGDHRAISQDSRCQGQVPIDNIIGRAFVIVWPSSRWSGLSAPATFDAVPQAAGAGSTGDPPAAGAPPVGPVLAGPTPTESVLLLPVVLSLAVTFRQQRRVSDASGAGGVVGSQGD